MPSPQIKLYYISVQFNNALKLFVVWKVAYNRVSAFRLDDLLWTQG